MVKIRKLGSGRGNKRPPTPFSLCSFRLCPLWGVQQQQHTKVRGERSGWPSPLGVIGVAVISLAEMLARAVNLIAGLGGRLGQITFLLRTDWTTEENNVRGRISDSVWSQRPCHSWSIRKLLYYTKRPAVKLLSKCYKCAGMAFRASLFHIQRYQTVGAVVELSQANSWKNLHHWLGTGVWGCTIER